jgi:hypothetical protein
MAEPLEIFAFGARLVKKTTNTLGNLHNDNGPALVYTDGTKSWWRNGIRHRLDGPAIERSDGTTEFYIDGVALTKEQFNRHPAVVAIQKRKEMIAGMETDPKTKQTIEDLWKNLGNLP